MKRTLIIDNYDSFTYNLVHCLEQLTGQRPDVFRNDEIDLDQAAGYENILLSPGPGVPEDAGICIDLIRAFYTKKKILGVCLGHQAIGVAFGGTLINLDKVYHGLATRINVTDNDALLFKNLPPAFSAGRYHSWVISKEDLPGCLKITCMDDNEMIMAVRHRQYNVQGVQFHPESVLTEHGMEIIRNWIQND